VRCKPRFKCRLELLRDLLNGERNIGGAAFQRQLCRLIGSDPDLPGHAKLRHPKRAELNKPISFVDLGRRRQSNFPRRIDSELKKVVGTDVDGNRYGSRCGGEVRACRSARVNR
jgi:hypothetical protein